MSIDTSKPEREGARPKWDLPEIKDIQIKRIPFKPPEKRNLKSSLAEHREAVEFLVKTDGPIPVRALGPALFIGDAQVIEVQKIDENLYRFLAFDIGRLKKGAPISWGWINDKTEEKKRKTRFIYDQNE